LLLVSNVVDPDLVEYDAVVVDDGDAVNLILGVGEVVPSLGLLFDGLDLAVNENGEYIADNIHKLFEL
jgi:hypothetical protein